MKNPGRHWKRILALALVLAVAAGCLPAFAETAKKPYTVMYYFCGADLERDNAQQTRSMERILATRYNQEAVNAVGLLGGTPRWAGKAFDPKVLNIVEIAGRRPSKADEMPLAPMSDPATLTAFMNYCAEHYPAEHYILVICDHGGGPLIGCCVDYIFDKTSLSINDLNKALADSVFANRGLDIIAFDCCLMGSAEIANNLSPYAQYMVGTEDAMYGIANDWLKDVEKDESVLETARRIAETTYLKNKEIIARQHESELNSVSVIDLKAITDMIPAMTDYFASMPELDPESFTRVSNHRRDAVDFGVLESGGNSQYDLVDIGSLVTNLEEDNPNGAALLEAIQRAVPYNYADVEGCAGMTVYHPYLNKLAAERYMELYATLGFSPAYVNYVIRYASIMTGIPLANWKNLMIELPEAQKDLRTLFTLTLNDEQAAHLGSSRMDVLLKEADGSYRFTYLTLDTSLEDQKITGEFAGTALYAVDADGQALTKPLPYRISANGTYLIPADITMQAEEGEEPVTRKALISCTLEGADKTLTPGGIAVWDDAMQGWTRNFEKEFADCAGITVALQTRKESRNADGILLPFDEWETAGEETWTAAIDGTWSFRLLNDTLDTGDLYAAFEVQDSQGNVYLSELHPVKGGPEPVVFTITYDDANLVKIDKANISLTAQKQLVLSMEVVNLTDTEAIVGLKSLTMNGEAVDETAEAFGNGANWGLLKDEKAILTLTVPPEKTAGIETLESVTFDLVLSNAADSAEIGTVPVTGTLQMTLNAK